MRKSGRECGKGEGGEGGEGEERECGKEGKVRRGREECKVGGKWWKWGKGERGKREVRVKLTKNTAELLANLYKNTFCSKFSFDLGVNYIDLFKNYMYNTNILTMGVGVKKLICKKEEKR